MNEGSYYLFEIASNFLSSTVKTIYKSKDVLCELNAHLPIPTFSWEYMKETPFTVDELKKSIHRLNSISIIQATV